MTALERDMAELRKEWKVVEHPPGAQYRMLHSFRETQLEQGRDIAVLKTDVAALKDDMSLVKNAIVGIDQRMTVFDKRMTVFDKRMTVLDRKLEHGMGHIASMLATVIERLPENDS